MAVAHSDFPQEDGTLPSGQWLAHLAEPINDTLVGVEFKAGVTVSPLGGRAVQRLAACMVMRGAMRVDGVPCELGDCSALKPQAPTVDVLAEAAGLARKHAEQVALLEQQEADARAREAAEAEARAKAEADAADAVAMAELEAEEAARLALASTELPPAAALGAEAAHPAAEGAAVPSSASKKGGNRK